MFCLISEITFVIKIQNMKTISSLAIVFLLVFTAGKSSAQILDRVMNRAINKAQQRLEDKAADLIAEQLTRYLEKQIDNYLRDAAREAAVQDSIERTNRGEKVTSADVQTRYTELLASMNDASKVAENYKFNIRLDTEVEENNKVTQSAMIMSQDKPHFAFRQEEEKQVNYLVFDLSSDVVVMYSDHQDGRKTGQAMPGFLRIAAHMVPKDSVFQAIKIKPGNKTKTIAGYICKQYWGESSEALFEWYAAEDMENLWTNSSYYPHMQRFTGQPNMDEWLQIKGMVLQSAYTDKGEKNSKVTWTVTKIDKSFNLTLSKKDYHFEGMSEKNEEKK